MQCTIFRGSKWSPSNPAAADAGRPYNSNRTDSCSSCGLRHEPPVGKYCQQAGCSPANGAGSGNVAKSSSAVGELEKRMGHIEAMLERILFI